MAKTIYVDGVNAIMRFNSGIEAYQQARQLNFTGGKCCYCQTDLKWHFPPHPGDKIKGRCPYCKRKIEYKTITMTYEIAKYFDVRGPMIEGSQLEVGGIMHIVLPERHPEFDKLLNELAHKTTSTKPASFSFQAHSTPVTALGILPGGSQFFSGGSDGIIHLWSKHDGRKLRTFSGHKGRILKIAAFQSHFHCVSSASDGYIFVWDIGTGNILHKMNYETLSDSQPNITISESDGLVLFRGLAVMPDNTTVIISPSELLGPHIWLPLTDEIYRMGHADIPVGANDIAITNSGTLAVTNSGPVICLWNMATGTLLSQIGGVPIALANWQGGNNVFVPIGNQSSQEFWRRVGGHTGDIKCLAISTEQKTVLSGGIDQTIKLWRINPNGALEYSQTFHGHKSEVIGIGVLPQSNKVVSCSIDGTVIIWDIKSLREDRKINTKKPKTLSFALASDDKFALTGASDGTVQVWAL